MIISRTPLRMSFVGGGSDIPAFYERFGGAVLSTTIDKYVFVTCNPKFDNGIRVAYSRTEEVANVDQIQHRIVRAALGLLEVAGGIEITTIADVPSRGTGLGSSSSFTVGLLNVLHAFQGRYASAGRLAEEACRVEIDLCGEPIGKQDQYAAAFGGFNLFEFQPGGRVDVTPVMMPAERRESLARRIVAFYTGVTRSTGPILAAQTESVVRDADKQSVLRRMTELAYLMKSELESGKLDSFGEILHENWELKKSLTPAISNGQIDNWYDTARRHGASGGKILGAGAGGFLIFVADENQHEGIARALEGLRRINLGFEPLGSRIIFYNL
jgi:D-glycero-alpha-D-manno-heptose-7-phosphate kinase